MLKHYKNHTIYYFIPWDTGKNIAEAYNNCMQTLPKNAWACFIDADVCFTTYFYGEQLEQIIIRYPSCNLFYATTNRIGCKWQIADEVNNNSNDMNYHRQFGAEQQKKYGTEAVVIDEKWPASGFFMLLKKSLWLQTKFKGNGMLGVDNNFYNDVRRLNEEIRQAKGVYLYHWYRFDTQNSNHLIHNVIS